MKMYYKTKMMTTIGALIAIEVILSRFFSISAWNIKIGFSFVPIAVTAILFGALPAGLMAAVSDVLGAVLFPIGTYFPGFTLTAFLTGVSFGLFFGQRQSAARVLGAVAVNQLVFGLILNTVWISILYSSPFFPLMMTRAIQCVLLGPVQFFTIMAVSSLVSSYRKKVLA